MQAFVARAQTSNSWCSSATYSKEVYVLKAILDQPVPLRWMHVLSVPMQGSFYACTPQLWDDFCKPGCFGMMAMSMEQQLFLHNLLWNREANGTQTFARLVRIREVNRNCGTVFLFIKAVVWIWKSQGHAGWLPMCCSSLARQHRCPGEIQGIGRSVHSQHTRTFARNARKIWKQLLEDEVSLQVSSMRWHNAKSMEMWKFGRKLFQTLWYQCLWPRKSNTVAVCRQFKNFWRSALNLSWGVGFWKLREMSIQLLYVGLWWIVFIWQACTLTINPA